MRTGIAFLLACVLSLFVSPGARAVDHCAPYADLSLDTSDECSPTCCEQHQDCFAAAHCTMEQEFPAGLSQTCEFCNATFYLCLGMCPFGVYGNGGTPEDCTPDCTEGICGAPDGCGGSCRDESYCAFLIRRPEFLTVMR